MTLADKVQQWAREAGAHTTYSGGLCLYAGQFEAFARLARADALDEAAKVCEDWMQCEAGTFASSPTKQSQPIRQELRKRAPLFTPSTRRRKSVMTKRMTWRGVC